MITFAATQTGMVVVYPRGQLTEADKIGLRDVGILAIEADDPSAVNILPQPLPPIQPLQYDDMLMSAMHGVSKAYAAQVAFAGELYRRLKLREAESKDSP